ncbi:MAG: heavy-metal-associated domain-containing protein [Actinomycetota bacterium]
MTPLSLTVTGMNCTGCEQRISSVLGRLDGVQSVQADHQSGVIRLEYDPSLVTAETIASRLADAGYERSDPAER